MNTFLLADGVDEIGVLSYFAKYLFLVHLQQNVYREKCFFLTKQNSSWFESNRGIDVFVVFSRAACNYKAVSFSMIANPLAKCSHTACVYVMWQREKVTSQHQKQIFRGKIRVVRHQTVRFRWFQHFLWIHVPRPFIEPGSCAACTMD